MADLHSTLLLRLLLLLAAAASWTSAQSTFSPKRPPSIPLAVRSPYLSTWQQAGKDGGNGGYLAGQWPTFWAGQTTGWQGLIRVDGQTYSWMGASSQETNYVNQTAFQYTSTRSTFTMDVGGLVQMTITMLSPVTPDDMLRASLPYSYMDVAVISMDGKAHNVQVYSDISAEWVSGDHSATAQWTYGTTDSQGRPALNPWTGGGPNGWQGESRSTAQPWANGIAYHKVWRQQQLEFSETNQQADWGNWYYTTQNTAGLTYQSGQDTIVRGQFLKTGSLANTADDNYRGINDNWPVFGFASDLGLVSTSTKSILFQVSLHQQNCIQFQGTSTTPQKLPCMWTNYFRNDIDALKLFYNDYSTGSSLAASFDSQIAKDSLASGGQNYLDLTSLAVRQAFGALEFANTPSSPYLFLKEISSDGNIQTVDVIFPFHPIALYSNATLLKYMLDPLFINQEAGHWPSQYSIHDLGSSFPNATGHDDGNDEMQPLEECGDMLIMTLAYAQRTGDIQYLSKHYNILNQWTQYLISDSLIPANQISTDDFAGALPNQTNLALKGMIGIEAMAKIANLTGHTRDGANYTNIAHRYINEWLNLGIDYAAQPPHAELAYGGQSTFVLLYNLFADAELGLGLVPQSVYDMQSAFYSTAMNRYGVPLDSRHTYTKVDWELFSAAVASRSTKDSIIGAVSQWLGDTPMNLAFPDLYDTKTGDFTGINFNTRPVVGAMFAPLALNSAPGR